jgi:polysaccharide biosynthesis protein PslH
VRILWVKAGGLLPLDSGGKIRSFHILRELAKTHAVTFFGFHSERDNPAHANLSSLCERVVCVPLRLPAPKSASEFAEYAAGVFSSRPYAIRKYGRPQVARELSKLVRNGSYDVIVCDFVVAAGVIPWNLNCPKVLFTHNVEATIWKRHYEVARNPLWKLLSWREWRAMERAENFYLKKADLVLAVSQADRDVFARLISPEKLALIPTGVDIEYFSPRALAEEENTLVFSGSMDWLPNEDGIVYFVQEILPLISQRIPGVKLTVVGRRPSRALQMLAAEYPTQVQLTGWVDDVRPYLNKGAVYIVPLRVGSGTRLKIFEAMSMAKAVVSTTIGAEGLPVSQAEILLADSPGDFAKCVVNLLQDSLTRHRLGAAARQLVESRYSWASVAAEFVDALHRVVPQLQGSTPGKLFV